MCYLFVFCLWLISGLGVLKCEMEAQLIAYAIKA
jgi:hypothetical protein